jgi:L-serine dehydratase
MRTSLFELFRIGIGPSSSHTVGPMRAAGRFARDLRDRGLLPRVHAVHAHLYGSLALTGKGHATDRAVVLGLMGEAPESVDPATMDAKLLDARTAQQILLAGERPIPFAEERDLLFHRDQMYPDAGVVTHPNGMRFVALDEAGAELANAVFYSVGGGFILSAAEQSAGAGAQPARAMPYPFRSAAELLAMADADHLAIWQLMLANECALQNAPQSSEQVRGGILRLWDAMRQCTERGMVQEGILPGGLNVRRRALRLAQRLRQREADGKPRDPLAPLDWVTVYAMAVNEENAAGGRVVTAPTNGAAGIVPAVAHYYLNFLGGDEDGLVRYFLTAAAIGILYKENASISGAEVGCQGEVGVACSMAAGGLVAAICDGRQSGASEINAQIEHAAEIGMEHNLGMTCDPIGGLVQIPCIERNAMGAVKAVNACRMAMNETEGHKVSLDQVIKTMYQTGLDMQSRYKETSQAGLALNVIAC